MRPYFPLFLNFKFRSRSTIKLFTRSSEQSENFYSGRSSGRHTHNGIHRNVQGFKKTQSGGAPHSFRLEREKENDGTYKNPERGELIELERIATMFHSLARYTSKTIRGDLHTAMTTTTIEFSPLFLYLELSSMKTGFPVRPLIPTTTPLQPSKAAR